MEKYMNMRNGIISLTIMALIGCAFNLDEVTLQKTAVINSAGMTKVRFGSEKAIDNFSITGSTHDSITAKVLLRQIVTKGSDGSLADVNFGFEIDGNTAEIVLDYSGADWETIQMSDFTLYPDDSLDVEVSCQSGNISVNSMVGYVTARDMSGNISIETVKGATVRDTSGNIEVTILKDDSLFQGVDLRTKSGNITVYVPNGFASKLDLHTTSGNKTIPDSSTTSRLNNYSGSDRLIQCSTLSGNIKIDEF
jgi:DUF4097 and DUF4098 domain-containing protein YvlB